MNLGAPAETIPRAEWDSVVSAFTAFFEPLGEVTVSDDEVEFAVVDTGLSLGRNGSSRSFMPLHDLGMRWDSIELDESAMEVRLVGAAGSYTYRVPPRLYTSHR